MVATKQEYNELVERGNRGEFPRVLTTDGEDFGQEFQNNYDQWKCDDTHISTIRCPDDWPTFHEATEMRRTVKRKK